MDRKILLQLEKTINTDIELTFYYFILWYNSVDIESKNYVNNFIVNTIDGKNIKFELLINKYTTNPLSDCIKEFKNALKLFIKNNLDREESNVIFETILE